MDDLAIYRTIELVQVRRESYLYPQHCDRGRREGEADSCQHIDSPSPVKITTLTRDVIPWSFKLVITYTFEFS
jgi:hypothetical protein